MRLSQRLDTELRIRLGAIAVEQASNRTARDLPNFDGWAIGLIFLASIIAAFWLRKG